MAASGETGDFIMDFVAFTKEHIRDTPDLFRRWCGISLVASALERRVWAPVGGYVVYPNMYTLLIAPSGHGKAIIDYAKNMLGEVKDPALRIQAFRLNPDNMTKASMIDELAKASVTKRPSEGTPGGPLTYHALSIYTEDINAWITAYDPEIFGALLYIWNNPNDYKETRRTAIIKERNIERPLINLLIGVQPELMPTIFPDEAWYTGFTRRAIIIYSYEKGERRRLSEFHPEDLEKRARFVGRLTRFSNIQGPAVWTEAAYSRLVEWDFAGGEPVPQHSKLSAYIKSRVIFVEKLSIISAVSRSNALTIELSDVERALVWLTNAEATMPDIFKAMKGKSDSTVMEDLWRWMNAQFNARAAAIPKSEILRWMAERVTSDRLDRMFQLADQADFIRKRAGEIDTYVPGPKGPGEY